jgi:hypothetical protein
MFSRSSILSSCTCALIALCFLSSACAKKPKGVITEQQVSAFLEAMDKAAQNNDLDAIIAGMSEDVRLKITLEGFGPTQTLTFDREQYRAHAVQSLGMTDFYDYRRGETVIKIEPGGHSAIVAAETYETSTIGNQTIGAVSRVTSILEMEDGKLVITRSEAVARPYRPYKPTGKARPTGF